MSVSLSAAFPTTLKIVIPCSISFGFLASLWWDSEIETHVANEYQSAYTRIPAAEKESITYIAVSYGIKERHIE